MYYLIRDELLTYASATPEGIVAEINNKLANFRTYGGLNFEVDELNIAVKFGRLSTNLLIKCDNVDEVETFIKGIEKNF
jgi:hypothetical protein